MSHQDEEEMELVSLDSQDLQRKSLKLIYFLGESSFILFTQLKIIWLNKKNCICAFFKINHHELIKTLVYKRFCNGLLKESTQQK